MAMERRSKRMLTTEDAADYLGLSPRTLEKWRKNPRTDGRPKGPDFHDLDGNIRYDVRDLDAYLKQTRKVPGEGSFVA